MEGFEAKLARATNPESRDILGAIGLVVDSRGSTLYRHADGHQSLERNAPALDPDSTVSLGSAGKFITHIAALQLVERGLLTLDEPVYKHVPELEDLCPLIARGAAGEAATLRRPARPITLRHLLLHTSGLSDHDAVNKRFGDGAADKLTIPDDAHAIVKAFAIPLLFEPGEGFAYGYSIHWTQLVVQRASGSRYVEYVQEHIFDPLGMASFTYMPRLRSDVWERRLRMVERETQKDGGAVLVAGDDYSQGPACSMSDMGAMLSAVLASSPKLLTQKEHVDLLFTGQFAPESASMNALRQDTDNYGFCAGKLGSAPPSVNWCAAGLVAEDTLPVSEMPKGTVTWEGMPNVLWAMNREKGLAMFFATQLVPVGDEKANSLGLTFMRGAWSKFG